MIILLADLEGTVLDNTHRQFLFKDGQWEAYEDACIEDTPYPTMHSFFTKLGVFFDMVFFVTGRSEKYEMATREQLTKQGLFPNQVMFRPKWDVPKTKEPLLKIGFYEHIKTMYPNATFIAMDDRDDVVEAYRNAGVECWQVRNGQIG